MIWSNSKDLGFRVNKYYNVLRERGVINLFLGYLFGLLKLCLVLLSLFGLQCRVKVLTIDNLRKKGIIIVDWCCICKSNGSRQIILSSLWGATGLWTFVFCLVGMNWVMPKSVSELLFCWKGTFGKKSQPKIWGVICYV